MRAVHGGLFLSFFSRIEQTFVCYICSRHEIAARKSSQAALGVPSTAIATINNNNRGHLYKRKQSKALMNSTKGGQAGSHKKKNIRGREMEVKRTAKQGHSHTHKGIVFVCPSKTPKNKRVGHYSTSMTGRRAAANAIRDGMTRQPRTRYLRVETSHEPPKHDKKKIRTNLPSVVNKNHPTLSLLSLLFFRYTFLLREKERQR